MNVVRHVRANQYLAPIMMQLVHESNFIINTQITRKFETFSIYLYYHIILGQAGHILYHLSIYYPCRVWKSNALDMMSDISYFCGKPRRSGYICVLNTFLTARQTHVHKKLFFWHNRECIDRWKIYGADIA